MNPSRRSRRAEPSEVLVPSGFKVEVVAQGLNLPIRLALSAGGDVYVAEMGLNVGQRLVPARIVQVHPDGQLTQIAAGFQGTVTALAFHDGRFLVGENDWPARIVRVNADGTKETLVSGLPGGGDHPTNGIVFGPDGKIYFGQGTVTNAGVIGPDNFEVGWLTKRPDAHDVPGTDVVISEQNFVTIRDPLSPIVGEKATTGPFVPFGTAISGETVIRGSRKCSGSILRANPDGSDLELIAWGLREAFGLAFSHDGRLFCVENGMENRGSRPIRGDVDRLWEVRQGAWYGWPDFAGGEPVTDPKFQPKSAPRLRFLLRDHPPLANAPLLRFPSLSGVAGLDFCPRGPFGFEGQAFICLAGDHAPHVPMLRGTSMSNRIVRVDLNTGQMEAFASNERAGPASATGSGGLERPIDVKFDPSGEAMYVLDYGVVDSTPSGPQPVEGTGVLWRIRRRRAHTPGFGGPR